MSMELVPAIETIYESFVRPSTSTPPSLRCYKLSYSDQIAMSTYIPLVFFYQNPNINSSESETTQILETTLSKTLSYYYPFAGRLRGNLFIECNDAGVHFLAVKMKCSMKEFFHHQNPYVKNIVFHKCLFHPLSRTDNVMLVQISYFNCSGIAVCICMSHKLGDASTLSTFMNEWAAIVHHQSDHIPTPYFVRDSIFPPLNDPSSIGEASVPPSQVPLSKFLFSAQKIAQLKDIVAKSGVVKNPTRIEVLSALLYRCAMVSNKAISGGSFRPATLVQTINLRPAAGLPKHSIGNIVSHFSISNNEEEEEEEEETITLPQLVSQLRNGKINVENEFKKQIKANQVPSLEISENLTNQIISQKTYDLYTCTSWCRIPFYEVDFGWGKPSSLGMFNWASAMNHFTFKDTAGIHEDSIEAIVMLKDANHMSAFQTNEELLAFASLIND